MGNEESAKESHYAKYVSSTNSYQWKRNAISIKAMKIDFPVDTKQTPDIIINAYYKPTFGEKVRFGYVRVPARAC